jgi:hypothetical protein
VQEYRRDARQAVTSGLGIIDDAVVKEGADETLDVAIAKSIRCLSALHRRTFYFAFSCKKTWEEVADLINEFRDNLLDLSVVQKYGRDALTTFNEEAASSPRARALQQWTAEYRRRQRG